MPLKQSNVRAFFKLDAKKGLFVQTEKTSEGWEQTASASTYTGNLTGFKKRIGEYEGRKTIKIQFLFDGGEGLEIVTATNNFVTASILNKLYSKKDLTNLPLEIRLYEKDGFISDWTGIIGEEKGLSWKLDDNTKMKKIIDDESRLDGLLKDLNSRIDSNLVSLASASTDTEDEDDGPDLGDISRVSSQEVLTGEKPKEQAEVAVEEEDDDLPF